MKVFPPRESSVSYIPAGDGKNANLFYSVGREGASNKIHSIAQILSAGNFYFWIVF
jgi:hypothetical protein